MYALPFLARPRSVPRRPCRCPRRRHRTATVCCLLLALAVITLSACGPSAPPPPASTVLAAMQAADPTLPPGAIYDRAAPVDAPVYPTDTLLTALYGSAVETLILGKNTASATVSPPRETVAQPQVDLAFFLAQALHPGEMAVFRCSDARTVTAAATLARTRLDAIRRAWADSEYAALVDRGVVAVEGSYVLLVVAEDPESILTAARRAIKE